MMQPWFPDAKLGIFIHWGIYAVDGTVESWPIFNHTIPYAEYMAQRHGFTASHYDPEAWAALFVESGARYAVLTSKHHDGVALWDTEAGDLSVVRSTPAGRDLIGPYIEALRNHGLRVGLYFSHLDWSHPDYASIAHPKGESNEFAYSALDEPDRWQRFLAFHRAQLRELCSGFGEIDLMWFDGDWGRSAEQWDMAGLRRQLSEWQPRMILNSRMCGHGDYATPEQGLPISPPEGPWEFCMTMNDNWGYRPSDTNYKSTAQLIRIFCEVIGLGGNLLLDIGPKADGTIPIEQSNRLRELGRWVHKHDEAIFDTVAGLPPGHFYGPSTLSKDRKALYLFSWAGDGAWVRGLKNEVVSATVVGKNAPVRFERNGGAGWMDVPGILWLDVPTEAIDDEVTVVKIELAEPLSLYRGPGQGVQ